MTTKRLELTPALLDAVDTVTDAERAYVPGRDSCFPLAVAKIALADAMLAAIGRADARLARLPQRASPIGVRDARCAAPKTRRRA